MQAERQHPPGDRPALRGQDRVLQGDGPGGAHQPPDRRAAEGRRQPHRRDRRPCRRKARCCPRPSSSSAARRARPSSTACRPKPRKVAGEGLGAAQEGPAPQVAGGGHRAGLDRGEGDRAAATSASAWRPCSSTGCGRTCACSRIPPSSTGSAAARPSWSRPIQKSEIAQKTSHNTYQIDGLPPTPICNPGRAAIEAVLNPADTKDLYFVADGAGGHVFAETLKDHNANVQKWRAGREGHARARPRRRAAADTPTTAAPAARGRRRRAPSCAPCRRPSRQPADKAPEAPAADAKREALSAKRRSRPSLSLPCPCMALRLQSAGASAASRSVARPNEASRWDRRHAEALT